MNNAKHSLTKIDYDPFADGELSNFIEPIEPQQEIWTACILGGDDANRAYNESVSLHLKGRFDTDAMKRALQQVIQRHEALRASFSTDGKSLCIRKEMELDIKTADISSAETEEQQIWLNELVQSDGLIPFDLRKGPLVKAAIIKLAEQYHIVKITMHHIICDGWSINTMLKDLAHFYSAFVKKVSPSLPEPTAFSDYALELRDYYSSESYEEIIRYWINKFRGDIPPLDLPADKPRVAPRTYKSRKADFTLDEKLLTAVKNVGLRAGCSVATTVIASFETFLYRITGLTDIVVGLPSAGQLATNQPDLIGHCVNFLPIRSTPDGNLSFTAYLKTRRLELMQDYENRRFTYGSLLKHLVIKRDPSRIALNPVIMNIEMSIDSELHFYGLEHRTVSNPKEFENFELFLNVVQEKDTLTLNWSYNSYLFSSETINLFHRRFEYLLRQVTTDPDMKLDDISLLSESDQSGSYGLQMPVSGDLSLSDMIYSAADKYADAVAIRFFGETVTYQELNDKSNQLARLLQREGLGPGGIAGISAERSIRMITALISVIKTGAAYLPVDPSVPQERTLQILDHAAVDLLLVSEKDQQYFSASTTKTLFFEDVTGRCDSFSEENLPAVSNTGNKLVYILHTSGSTGKPKGVCMGEQALVNLLKWQEDQSSAREGSVTLQFSPITFDVSFQEIFSTLTSGGTLALITNDLRLDAAGLLDYIGSFNVSRIFLPFVALQNLAEAGAAIGVFPQSLKEVMTAGEQLKITPQIVQFFSGLQQCTLYNQYGPTESHVVTQLKLTGQPHNWPVLPSIGSPIYNTQIHILNPSLKEEPTGVVGELCIGGIALAEGYLKLPEMTGEKFVEWHNTDHKPTRIYRTGDLARLLANGDIEFLGRKDTQVKIRGYRIELGEIESALSKFQGIRQAVVTVQEDIAGNKRIIAYLLMNTLPAYTITSVGPEEEVQIVEGALSDQQINQWKKELEQQLPEYMIPFEFVCLNKMPFTSSGKIDRKMLPKITKFTEHVDTASYIAPRTLAENLVAQIWSEALGIEKISITSNFFELGGHSSIAVRVISQLTKETAHKLPLTSLFRYPVLEEFASLLEDKKEAPEGSAGKAIAPPVHETAPKEDIYIPATESQTEICLACILGGEEANSSYTLSVTEDLTGIFDRSAFDRALEHLILRHELLRACFSDNGETIHIRSKATLAVHYEDLSELNDEQRLSALKEFYTNDSKRTFDLWNGPLFRVSLLKLNQNRHRLIVYVHHIICDGWSLKVVMDDLAALYSAYHRHISPSLPPAAKFSEYARELHHFYTTDEYAKIETYWIKQHTPEAPYLNLPIDFPRPEKRAYESGCGSYAIAPHIIERVKDIGATAGCSLAITLRIAFETFMYRLSGQADMVVGLPIAGQMTSGKENLVGHCIFLLPLRVRIHESDPFIDHLRLRKQDILEAYDHQELTFGSLLKKIQVTRDQSRIPLVPVVLNINMDSVDEGVQFSGLENRQVTDGNSSSFSSFELAVNATYTREGLSLEWFYNTSLFRAETIEQFHRNFEFMLQSIAQNPYAATRNIPLYDTKELILHLDQWNQTDVPYDRSKTVHSILSETAARFPENIAVSFGSNKLTYRTVDKYSNQLANLLLEKGVQPGDRIGLAVDRSAEMIIALFGIMKAGAVYLPFDTNHPKNRISYMLEDAGATLLLTSERYAQQYPGNIPELYLERVMALLPDFSTNPPNSNVNGDDLIYILHTSGSTGKPKGVKINHRNVVNFLLSMEDRPGIQKSDRLLAITPISFDMAVLLYLPLICGAELVMADLESSKDGRLLYDVIRERNISWMIATPSTWQMIIDAGWNEPLPLLAISAGEALSKDLAKQLLDRSPSVWNGYGPTETTVMVLMKQIMSVDDPITLGYPVHNTQIYILDKQMNRLPIGQSGEIFISGDGVGEGYHNLIDLTNRHFLDNPFSSGEGKMYRTGDLGKFLPNGEVQYFGRIDHQVKIRGHRIELEEIEQNLIKLDDIKTAIVNPFGDKQENMQLVAYVIPAELANANDTFVVTDTMTNLEQKPYQERIRQWKTYLKSVLPEYMVPNEYVVVDGFALTENGKTDRKKLPPPPSFSRDRNTNDFVAPTTPTEKMLAAIWAGALQRDRVSINDDFFRLGGHSLAAVKVMVAIESETGKRLPLATLFQNSTIEKLARLIDEGDHPTHWNLLVPIKASGNRPPLYIVHGNGMNVLVFHNLADYLDKEQPVYGLQARGLNGTDKPDETIEQIAAGYVSEIIQQNPDGPYLVSGYSSGGVIAFEMARQLRTMGKEVPFLGFFDAFTYRNDYLYLIRRGEYTAFIKYFFKRMNYAWRSFLHYRSAYIDRYFNGSFFKFIGGILYNIYAHLKPQKAGTPEYIVSKIQQAHEKALKRYNFSPYDGKAFLFKDNRLRMSYYLHSHTNGWDPYINGDIVITDIPAEHLDFFEEPYVQIVAAELQKSLDTTHK